jgi:lipoyl-dependent peroxiredoxin
VDLIFQKFHSWIRLPLCAAHANRRDGSTVDSCAAKKRHPDAQHPFINHFCVSGHWILKTGQIISFQEIQSFCPRPSYRNQKCLNFKIISWRAWRRYRKIMIRLASAIWQAGLKDGTGIISTESGVLKQTPYSAIPCFDGRVGTDPGELIAAAHAASFSMALAAELDKVGLVPENIRTAAGLTMEWLENEWIISQIHLDVTVKIPEADWDKFEAAASAAKTGCATSRLLNTKITMDAKLESWKSFGVVARKSGSIRLGRRLATISLQEA